MTTRHITTSHSHDVCDICGRTLLRGERTETFLDGARRYAVCELCKPRALHEGWVREGTIPDFQGSGGGVRQRRSLLGRLRVRRDDEPPTGDPDEPQLPQTLDDELSVTQWPVPEPVATRRSAPDPALEPDPAAAGAPRSRGRRERARERVREPRHVHAVPTRGDHKVAAAAEAFNRSEHIRTVAGVSRSLGAPAVSLTPDLARPTVVWLVVSWELCWYRYEIELSDDPGSVRLDSQGYELDELAGHERVGNAAADEAGRLLH